MKLAESFPSTQREASRRISATIVRLHIFRKLSVYKNPDKMSERELRNEVKLLRAQRARTVNSLHNKLSHMTVHMEGNGLDPYDCQLSDVMLSVRKIMRASVEMTVIKFLVVEPDRCCDDEDRNWNGGCNSCGDPSY